MNTTSESNFNKNFLISHFNNLKDPRCTYRGNLRHSLSDILLLTLSAVICNCQEWDSILLFGEQEIDWLKKHGSFSNGLPSKDTLRRFFTALDPKGFQDCFMNWVASLRETETTEIIALDGKTIRGASNFNQQERDMTHILSAFSTAQQLCLGQLKVNQKSNEITAIPKLLDLLSVNNSTITIDAMGCQKAVVEKIRSKQANYLIAVKENQKELHLAIKDTLLLEKPAATDIDHDCGHGRVEKRICKIYKDLSHFENRQQWKDLTSFIVIKTEVYNKTSKKTSKELRFYISNLESDASTINKAIRKHWAIENQLHWVLDVVFNEDDSRKRTLNAAENFNIIIKTALTLINKDKSVKKSKNNKRLKALLNRDYREKVLMF